MIQFSDYAVALLDIEGTTTSISFVYEALFPYAREHLASFLAASADDPAVQADLALVRQQAAADRAEGIDAPEDVLENLRWQMDTDRKTTGLKSLQGKIWRGGYLDGSIKGHVYPDVSPALLRLRDSGRPAYIYSSGSIAAQKLLFGQSVAGDLLPLIAGHFDTTTGPKKVAESYTAIAGVLGQPVDRVLFGTDSLAEAQAAGAAGMQVALFVRPGNHALPEGHGFTTVASMDALI
jgi:2,3-diketo-5-methylthio-1-phosphopentane phosphatase